MNPAVDRRARPPLPDGGGRARLPLHFMAEAAARMALAYARDQHGFRRRRPVGRFLARNAAFIAAGRRQRLIEAEMSGLKVLLPTADRTIARSVYASGDWDPLLVGTAFDALRGFGHDVRGTIFLEIGANFGVYSLPAVARLGFGRAIGYEPDPEAYALLQVNIRRNGLAACVTAHNVALSDRPGEVTLTRSRSNAGDNRIVTRAGERSRGRESVRVRAATFDEEVAAGAIPLNELGLVWLDVQGHEAQVLAGAGRLLASNVPLVLEYSSRMMTNRARHLLHRAIAGSYDYLVDLGWCALTGRLHFQPASAIDRLAAEGRELETDLLLLNRA